MWWQASGGCWPLWNLGSGCPMDHCQIHEGVGHTHEPCFCSGGYHSSICSCPSWPWWTYLCASTSRLSTWWWSGPEAQEIRLWPSPIPPKLLQLPVWAPDIVLFFKAQVRGWYFLSTVMALWMLCMSKPVDILLICPCHCFCRQRYVGVWSKFLCI